LFEASSRAAFDSKKNVAAAVAVRPLNPKYSAM